MLLAGAVEVEVNIFAQGALQQFTQWLWIEHPTFELGSRHFTTELMLPQVYVKGLGLGLGFRGLC